MQQRSINAQQANEPPGWFNGGDEEYSIWAFPIRLMSPDRDPVQNLFQSRCICHQSKARSVLEKPIEMMKTQQSNPAQRA